MHGNGPRLVSKRKVVDMAKDGKTNGRRPRHG
jgi:hypothetical protein